MACPSVGRACAELGLAGSADVDQTGQGRGRLTQGLLLLLRERSDLLREPALTRGAVGVERGAAAGRDRDLRAAPVAGVRTAFDQPVGLEVADRLTHRL